MGQKMRVKFRHDPIALREDAERKMLRNLGEDVEEPSFSEAQTGLEFGKYRLVDVLGGKKLEDFVRKDDKKKNDVTKDREILKRFVDVAETAIKIALVKAEAEELEDAIEHQTKPEKRTEGLLPYAWEDEARVLLGEELSVFADRIGVWEKVQWAGKRRLSMRSLVWAVSRRTYEIADKEFGRETKEITVTCPDCGQLHTKKVVPD